MPAAVGIDIENYEIVVSAVQDEIVGVSIWIIAKITKDAAV